MSKTGQDGATGGGRDTVNSVKAEVTALQAELQKQADEQRAAVKLS